jgi:hypothetical protein
MDDFPIPAVSEIKSGLDLWSSLKNVRTKATRLWQYLLNGPFINEKLLKILVWEHDAAALKDTSFIKYSNWQAYYKSDDWSLELLGPKSVVKRRLPYAQLLDLVTNPAAKITVKQPIGEYCMPDDLKARTEAALAACLETKRKSFDGPVARIADFKKGTGGNLHCVLERAGYFSQVRTNLTLDYTTSHNGPRNLRLADMTRDGNLRTLRESLLVNSLGVAAIVAYERDGQWFYLAKLRKREDAINEMMLASPSGVAELIRGQPVRDLGSFAASEMLREFYFETGLPSTIVRRIVPLSFCREFVRGGKPQFFFFIEINPVEARDFADFFAKSREGLLEYYNRWHDRASSFRHALSPEFVVNFLLTLQFLQKENHIPMEPIQLFRPAEGR